MIKISNITMCYGDLKAVDDLSIHVKKGEIYAFLGPNAAGKTTTMMIVTGLLKPLKGSVEICGIDLNKDPDLAKSKIGFIPDVAIFYEKLTALEFMKFIGNLYSIESKEFNEATDRLFIKFNLNEYRNDIIKNLSHGTKQRLAIASTMLHKPKVLIIDEPMVGLDPMHSKVIKTELLDYVKKGNCVFMSTHLLNIAEELADRIGILDHGKLILEGTLEEIAKKANLSKDTELEKIFLSFVENN